MNDSDKMCGIIFDMDGVLFDTEKLYERFWVEAAVQKGYAMDFYDVAAIRSTDARLARKILKSRISQDFDYEGVKKLRIALMQDYVERNGIEVKQGIVELLQYAKEHGYKIGLASTSPLDRAKQFLQKGGLLDYFDDLMTGDQVIHGKPHPQIYEKAAGGLRIRPKQCYAVEDSLNGVRSAYAAGCKVLCVPDRDEPKEEMQQKSFQILPSAREIIDIL